MCCSRLAESTGRKRSRQKSPSGHHRTTLSGYIFATKARIDNRKKLVKQQYVLHMSPQYGELRPTSFFLYVSDTYYGQINPASYTPNIPVRFAFTARCVCNVSRGVNYRGQGHEPPRIWSGDSNANCPFPSDLITFQKFQAPRHAILREKLFFLAQSLPRWEGYHSPHLTRSPKPSLL